MSNQEIDKEVVKSQVESLRKRLLDFSKRNDLLNHTHSERSTKFVRVVDELPNELFDKLISGNMEFKPLPHVETEPKDEQTPLFQSALEIEKITDVDYQQQLEIFQGELADVTGVEELERNLKDKVRKQLNLPLFQRGKLPNPREYAKAHGFNPNYDLPEQTEELQEAHTDKYIQTLLLPDKLDRRLRSLFSKYQSFLSDTGINVLRAAFGYLEWTEDESSSKKLFAPLIMLPLTMQRVGTGAGAKFPVGSGGQPAELNMTLQERLKAFDVELPDFDEEDNPETYFRKLEPLFRNKPNWKLRRFVTIGIFPFQKISMFKDLEPESWPGDMLLGNQILARLLSGLQGAEEYGVALDEYDIDKLTLNGEAPPIYLDADSSQHSAILDALNGENLVIQGPPGTGKSQTIANIIAAAVQKKKKVLFVAEKQAALNVVASRLRKIGLSPCILDLHKRNDRTSLNEGIKERLLAEGSAEKPKDKGVRGVLNHHIKQFDEHSKLLNEKSNFLGLSGFELLWRYLNFKARTRDIYLSGEFNFQPLPNFEKSLLDANLSEIYRVFGEEVSDEAKALAKKLEGVRVTPDPISVGDTKQRSRNYLEKSRNLKDAFNGAFNELRHVLRHLDKEDCESIGFARTLIKLADIIEKVDFSVLNKFNAEQNYLLLHPRLEKIDGLIAGYIEALSHLRDGIHLEAIEQEYKLRELKELLHELEKNGWLRKFSSGLKEALAKCSVIGFATDDKRKAASQIKLLIRLIESKRSIETLCEDFEGLNFIDGVKTSRSEIQETIGFCQLVAELQNDIAKANIDKIFVKDLFTNPDVSKRILGASSHFSINSLNDLESVADSLRVNFGDEKQVSDIEIGEFEKLAKLFNGTEDAKLIEALRVNISSANIENENLSHFLENERVASLTIQEASDLYNYLETEAHLRLFAGDKASELVKWPGNQLAELRRKFVKNDSLLMKFEAEDALYNALQTKPPSGNSRGLKSTYTEMSLIRHEMTKKRTSVSVRQLVRRAAGALTALKPVWMMSPLAVSQFLEKKPGQFDLLIIDEASQMRPEDALPSVLRAKQIVVVGDNQQLPPTNFFESSLEAGGDDEEDIQQESILDLAATRIANSRTLRWHYRSRHPDLIRFSNKRFYDNRLLIVPTPTPESPELGITHIAVDGAMCSSSSAGSVVNRKEAERAVEEAVTHMTLHPTKSLGIVAMNVTQKEYIREMFEQQLSTNKAVRDYFEAWQEDELEPFIIRNLESIQGDERDVIIISTVYGPNETGTVRQNFGPINRYYGARRLNVLFSRAKEKVILVTSLKPNDISVENHAQSTGKAALQEYIKFASTGILEVGETLDKEPDSDFEIAVIRRLQDLGFEAVPQVGVQGFRIDIGVKHADFQYGFLAGIECDGATYHSSRSARDRDRIRQDILEGLGWKIYRIWSTDWFQQEEKELEKLSAWLEEAKKIAIERVARNSTQRRRDGSSKSQEPASNNVLKLDHLEKKREKTTDKDQSSNSSAAIDETSAAEEQTSNPSVANKPYGRRREYKHGDDSIIFYEDNAEFFELWDGDVLIGEIEKVATAEKRAVLFAGQINDIEKPRYDCNLLKPVELHKRTDDIYKALIWVWENYKENQMPD